MVTDWQKHAQMVRGIFLRDDGLQWRISALGCVPHVGRFCVGRSLLFGLCRRIAFPFGRVLALE